MGGGQGEGERAIDEVRRRWRQGEGWPPGVHWNATAKADVAFLLDLIDRQESLARVQRSRSVGHYPCDLFPTYVLAELPDGEIRRYFPS